MRILAGLIIVGPLMLIGALPSAAGDPTPDRDSYVHQAQDQMQEWQRKLHDLGEKAETKGKEAGTAAGNDLNDAWTKAQAASRKLQSVGAEGWESAKTSFEKASHDLAETWHKIHPDDK